jgi:hypothetical protein
MFLGFGEANANVLTCTMSQPFFIAESVRICFSITYFSTLVEYDVNLRRYLYTQVGHSPLLSSFSACKSSLRLILPSSSCHFFFAESQYGIANELSHFFLFVYGWLALQPCCTVRFPNSLLYVLIPMLVSAEV